MGGEGEKEPESERGVTERTREREGTDGETKKEKSERQTDRQSD